MSGELGLQFQRAIGCRILLGFHGGTLNLRRLGDAGVIPESAIVILGGPADKTKISLAKVFAAGSGYYRDPRIQSEGGAELRGMLAHLAERIVQLPVLCRVENALVRLVSNSIDNSAARLFDHAITRPADKHDAREEYEQK